MEKPLYPSSVMRITQGYNVGSHKDSFAIDDAGKDTGISRLKAPFTGIIKKIYQQDANEVWLESMDQVEYPDGTIDYMTMMFAHSNDVSDLFVGKKINKGEEFYSEGTKGNASGNHCHFECGKGKFVSPGWYKNNSGYYSIYNGKNPEECLWIDPSITILNNNNYNFKSIVEAPSIEEPEETDDSSSSQLPEEVPQEPESSTEDESSDTKQLIFTCPKTDLYGIYLKENQKLYIER